MARNVVQPIIRKKKRRAEEGHHGGAWKIAYADFVTAMMAFFLLMWLINVTSPEQKTGIAEYFNPITVSQRTAGSGGVLDGTTVSAPGPLSSATAEMSVDTPLSFPPRNKEKVEAEATEQQIEQAIKEREKKQFEEVTEKLRKSVQDVPELAGLLENLIIDETPEGLRIQLVDRDERPMFALGGVEPFDYTKQLLTLVAQAVGDLPNKLSIRGHTDSLPFANGQNYDNWDLSSERALASRRVMREAGIADERIEGVVGRADRDPLFLDHPEDPRNRRISIILLHEQPGAAAATPAVAPEPAPPAAAGHG